jgi:hypothetical protein
MFSTAPTVIPAKAGIYCFRIRKKRISAFAGMAIFLAGSKNLIIKCEGFLQLFRSEKSISRRVQPLFPQGLHIALFPVF